MTDKVLKLFVFLLLCTVVVVPNSMQVPSAALLFASAVVSALVFRPARAIPSLLKLYVLSVIVSIVYVFVGQMRMAPEEAARQVLFIYIIAPALWIFVSGGMLVRIEERVLIRWFIYLTFAALISICIFFYLFASGGEGAVSFFIDTANVDLDDGNAGATMFVYGSLIFLSASFFAVPGIVRNVPVRVLLLAALVVAALTSGRTALMLSIPVGLAVGFFCHPKVEKSLVRISPVSRFFQSPFLYMAVACVACVYAASIVGIDIERLWTSIVDKISSGGGEERADQATALLNGAAQTLGIGSGHGIGVSVVRSDLYPWRYETVWLATLHRVGVLGALVYALPFILTMKKYMYLRRKRAIGDFDLFMFSGFVSAFIASNTNPYIESFIFQWMFVIPMVSIHMKHSQFRLAKKSDAPEFSEHRSSIAAQGRRNS